jgi:tripartite-type tricarboxylate transporter receptor subunit TctC
MATSGSIAINPNLYANPGYQTLKDLSPIGLISSTPIVLMAHPSAPGAIARRSDRFGQA